MLIGMKKYKEIQHFSGSDLLLDKSITLFFLHRNVGSFYEQKKTSCSVFYNLGVSFTVLKYYAVFSSKWSYKSHLCTSSQLDIF